MYFNLTHQHLQDSAVGRWNEVGNIVHGNDGVSGRDVPNSNGPRTGCDTVEDELESKSPSTLLETGLLCGSTMLVPSCSLFTSTNSCLESNHYYTWSTNTLQMSFDHLNTNLYRCVQKSIPSKQSITTPATKAYNSIRRSQAVNFTPPSILPPRKNPVPTER